MICTQHCAPYRIIVVQLQPTQIAGVPWYIWTPVVRVTRQALRKTWISYKIGAAPILERTARFYNIVAGRQTAGNNFVCSRVDLAVNIQSFNLFSQQSQLPTLKPVAV